MERLEAKSVNLTPYLGSGVMRAGSQWTRKQIFPPHQNEASGHQYYERGLIPKPRDYRKPG